MASVSRNFQLQRLGAGDALSLNDWAFTEKNIEVIDVLLKYLADHTHDGTPPPQEGPEDPPALDLVPTTVGAGFPAETTIFYRYSHVDPTGTESVASVQSSVTTPAPLAVPEAPIVEWGTASGALPPGTYLYRVSVWTGSDTLETPAGPIGAVLIPTGNPVARAVLTLPDLPAGADGWNVYRRSPGGVDYQLVASVEAADGVTFEDGGLPPSGLRFAPTYDTSQNSTNVTITVDNVPAGWSWRVYRSLTDGSWGQSLLDTIPAATETFTDTGVESFDGAPREAEIHFPAIQPVGYTPETPSDWADVPDTVPEALDMLAAGGVGSGGGGAASSAVVELGTSGSVSLTLGRVNTLAMSGNTTVTDATVPSGHAGWAILDVEDADAHTLTLPSEWGLPSLSGRSLIVIQYVDGQDPVASVIDETSASTPDAADVTFTPTTSGDWTTSPVDVLEALDELAARESGGAAIDAPVFIDLSGDPGSTVAADLSGIGSARSVWVVIASPETVELTLPDPETANGFLLMISGPGIPYSLASLSFVSSIAIPDRVEDAVFEMTPVNSSGSFFWRPRSIYPAYGTPGYPELIDVSGSTDDPIEVDLSGIGEYTNIVMIQAPAADVAINVTALPAYSSRTGSLWIGAMSDGSHRTSLQLPGGLGSSFSPASNAPAWLSLRSAGGVGWLPESTYNPHMMGFRADEPERWPGVPFSVGEALDLLADGLRRFASTAFVEDPPGTIELSPGSGPWMQLTLDGNKTIGLAAAGSYNEDNALELWIIQDGSGGHTVTWDSAIKWPGGTPPTLPTGANARSLIEFRSIDEGVTWYGMPKGLDFS